MDPVDIIADEIESEAVYGRIEQVSSLAAQIMQRLKDAGFKITKEY